MRRFHSYVIKALVQARLRPRLMISLAAGAALFVLLGGELRPALRTLLAWDLGAGLYLGLAWPMMARASVERMRLRAREQDDGAGAVLVLTVAAALASLAAILLELSGLKDLPPLRQGGHLLLAGGTFALSWLLVHTSFALHYAHAYYMGLGRGRPAALQFPADETPGYLDFLYFSMVIGMTSQTADVALASTRMRRLAMVHGGIAFLFNTSLLALSINVAAGLIG